MGWAKWGLFAEMWAWTYDQGRVKGEGLNAYLDDEVLEGGAQLGGGIGEQPAGHVGVGLSEKLVPEEGGRREGGGKGAERNL